MGVTLDIATLFVVTVFISGLGGCLLLFSWLQNRRTRALAWWGIGLFLFAPACGLISGRGQIADAYSIQLANTFLLLAYGFMWTGARVFEGRQPNLWAIGGSALWLLMCQSELFYSSFRARAVFVSGVAILYSLLFIRELWHGRQERLMSRWPIMGLVALHAALFTVRVPLVAALPFPFGTHAPDPTASVVLVFMPLFFIFALVFLLVALTKERAELYQREAATIDPLTGIPNRRGFHERAARVIARSKPDNAPVTLLLLDLDNFKNINDRFGHRMGDRLLEIFAHSLTQSLRPLDQCGRIGGEEFVALLPGVTADDAQTIGDRVRDAFAREAHVVDGVPVGATVSIGSASTTNSAYDFDVLYGLADAALYRAKRKGRNRLESAPPPMQEQSRRPAAVVTPIAANG